MQRSFLETPWSISYRRTSSPQATGEVPTKEDWKGAILYVKLPIASALIARKANEKIVPIHLLPQIRVVACMPWLPCRSDTRSQFAELVLSTLGKVAGGLTNGRFTATPPAV